jgi:hypothetical protein
MSQGFSKPNLTMAKRFRIALSFAGENRKLVEEIAQILATLFGRDRILYDKFHEAEFARLDLAFHLPNLYKNESDLVVLVFCDDYENKQWCKLEWRAIYSLIMNMKDQDIMLMRFNRLEPIGLHGLAGFIELDGLSAFQVAGLILERLALNEGKTRDHYASRLGALQSLLPSPQSPAVVEPSPGSLVLVRTFTPRVPDPAGLALPPLDLTDLFNGRYPCHADVWSGDIPQRVAAFLPALADLPKPLVLALQTHLSIGWYLGTLLNPKRGFSVNVSQRTNAGEIVWDLSRAQPPDNERGWLLTEEPLNRGQDLALVVSVTHDARLDAKRAIDTLALPIGRLAHAGLQQPGPDAVVDGGHARWLADALAMQVRELVVADPPRRLHVFAACPVGLMLLFGQRADAWGPTTVYEFAFEDGSRSYFPGMVSGLV